MTKSNRNSIQAAVLQAGITLGLLLAASLVGYLFRVMGLPETDIAIVYLLAVLLTARFTDQYLWGFLSSLLSAFFFNFLFIAPYYTLSINTRSYIVTLTVMAVTALVTSTLTTHARQNALRALEKEAESKTLYTLTNRLTDAADMHDIAGVAADAVSEWLKTSAGCLCFDENGMPEREFVQQVSEKKRIHRETGDADALRRRIRELRTEYDAGAEFYDWPIHGRESVLGLIRIPCGAAKALTGSQAGTLRAMVENTALAMDRLRAAQQRLKSSEEAVQERYRGNLLRAISHDLRTPLAGILGTAEMALNMTQKEDRRYDMIAAIRSDANWLSSLVENILSLTRLQDGKLVPHKQQEAAEEVVGVAVGQISRRFPEYELTVHVPDEVLFVPMDAKLIEQVLINLLENAVKHTPPEGEISVSVTEDGAQNRAVFTIRDSGEGIAPVDLPHVFQTFYTSKARHSDARPGVGLGLAICDAAVRAHGGSIEARNRTDGPGAEFVFTLPLEVGNHESV